MITSTERSAHVPLVVNLCRTFYGESIPGRYSSLNWSQHSSGGSKTTQYRHTFPGNSPLFEDVSHVVTTVADHGNLGIICRGQVDLSGKFDFRSIAALSAE